MVTNRGIKANPKKIQAIEEMLSKNSLKKDFEWTTEAENAFQKVKKLLKELPTLTALVTGETLILYMTVSVEGITSSEANYPPIKKLVYALVHTVKRLRLYFQGHPILVLTDQSIKQILKCLESSGRLVKLAVELGEYVINFAPRDAVKGQILADFLLETSKKFEKIKDPVKNDQTWELHTDGASSEEGIGAGLVLTNQDGEGHTYELKFNFYASNNEAEYEALLSGLHIAVEMGVRNLRAYVDSQIMAQQVNMAFETRDASMKKYLSLVENILKKFESLEVIQI
ncbi:uncharacterized protein [Rutidosis leptorrhynchoides]|uniref:uncharacterized protein n=1 Tax=Rutidosis leptorrhynchoides TaxID=125765 RepID=UPI003A99B08A